MAALEAVHLELGRRAVRLGMAALVPHDLAEGGTAYHRGQCVELLLGGTAC